jgi:transcriptional/translational regulatory protein YebC/TACO1
MSGHSKWATTKHKKAAADSKRGKVFTKIEGDHGGARLGGGDGRSPRLRTAVAKRRP